MEHIARTILNLKREQVLEYASSLHFLPVAVTAAMAPVAYLAGYGQLGMISLYAGLAVMALVSWLEPLTCLAPLSGPYNVGIKEIDSTKDTSPDGWPPITVFYPTTEETKSPMRWLPFMDMQYLEGMARYAKVPPLLLRDMQLNTLQATMDAKPHPLFRRDGSQRPIFVHSHGLAGFARLYSTLLSSVAAQGSVVVALNHADASAAYCRDSTGEGSVKLRTDMDWTYADREPQLRTRVEETQNTIASVLNGSILKQAGFAAEEVDKYVKGNPQVILMGHSFGGATVLATAHEEEKKMRQGGKSFYKQIAGVIAHDPWWVPLWGRFMKPKEGEPFNEAVSKLSDADRTYSVPTLLHHSQAWKMDEESWGYFSALDEKMHAQADTEGLLNAAQRERIEKATAIMAKAMAPEEGGQPSEEALSSTDAEKPSDKEAASSATEKAPFVAEDWFVTHVAMETGHLSFTDLAFLSPVVFKKSYQTDQPAAPMHQWADEAMRFAEIHVENNRRL